MKKKLNTEGITNELEGASLFFTKSTTPPSLPEPEKQIFEKYVNPTPDSSSLAKADSPITQAPMEENQAQKRTNVPSYVRTDVRTDERTDIKSKRQKIRHAFDIYQDQHLSLQMRQLEAVQKGKRKPKLGNMVQQAIDLYLKQAENNKKRA